MQAEKSYPHETRIIYISQNAPIILEKNGIVKLKRKSSSILCLSFNINECLNIDNTEIYFESILLKI